MGKIFNARELDCEKDQYDKSLRCRFKSKGDRVSHYEKDVEHIFIIKEPNASGDNLTASGYANSRTTHMGFFNKKCAVVKSKPIRSDDGKILVESQKEVTCSDSLSTLKKHIKEQEEGY